jgi:formate-dependent phosphoribosylglycinamide formyltransferase (GAR transformylase)
MTKFSVLVTNSRNGGQHELVLDAMSSDQVVRLIALTRPHYIIKRIDAI